MPLRIPVLGAPLLLFLYGVCRLIDGLDGDHGPGLWWNVGHTLFLGSFLLFAALTVQVRLLAPAHTTGLRVLADAATGAGLVGVGCFLWVIVGDLWAAFPSLPEPLELAGPVLFQVGQLVLLTMLVMARRLPAWSPLLVLFGFVALAVNLDLIPLGALLILGGLIPLRHVQRPSRGLPVGV